MQCPHCHIEVAPNPFCSNCGSPLHVDVEPVHYDDIDPHRRPTRQSPAATPQPRPRFPFQQHAGPVRVDYDDYHVEVFDAPPDDAHPHTPVAENPGADEAVEELLSILQATPEELVGEDAPGYDDEPETNDLALGEPDAGVDLLDDGFEDSLGEDLTGTDAFQDDVFIDSDPFADDFFGDEGFAFGDDDSGPIPMSAPQLDAVSLSDDVDDDDDDVLFSHKPRRRRRRQRVPGGTLAQWRDQLAHLPRKPMLIGAAIVLLVGLSWAMLGGDPPDPEANSTMASSRPDKTASSSAAAQQQTRSNNVLEGLEAAPVADDERLIPIRPEPAEADDPEHADADDSDDPRSHALFPKSALLASTKPLSTRPRKLNRPCVLRAGPSSRFSALVPSLKPGTQLTVLAMSSDNWRTASHKGQHGWVNRCDPAKQGCTLHEGPGKHFRPVSKARPQQQPRSRVVSSNRWRYVKHGDLYGWTGPACWK